jgi:hypothetical protein
MVPLCRQGQVDIFLFRVRYFMNEVKSYVTDLKKQANMAGSSSIALRAIRRSLPSVIIFTGCFSAIYADYTHTQQWKRTTQMQRDLLEKARL